MAETCRWILDLQRPSLTALTDDFVIPGFRIRLLGPTLEIESRADDKAEAARRLAEEYVSLLRAHGLLLRLLTHKEFAAMPPAVMQPAVFSQKDEALAVRAIRGARRSLLATSDIALSRCYEYRDQMNDEPERALFHAYKLIETLEAKLGGKAGLIEALDLEDKIRYVKQAASDTRMDERHAPRDLSENAVQPPLDRVTALAYTQNILHAYEEYLRDHDWSNLAR